MFGLVWLPTSQFIACKYVAENCRQLEHNPSPPFLLISLFTVYSLNYSNINVDRGVFVSLGAQSGRPRFRSHVKSIGDFSLLQIDVL